MNGDAAGRTPAGSFAFPDTAVATKETPRMNARHRLHRPQDPPADRLGERRLRRHRHHAADRRRAARRGLRPALGRARARRRRRQRQRHAGGRAPRLPRDLDRLRASRCSIAAPSAPTPKRLEVDVPGRRRRGAAVRGRELRRGALHVRRDVRARPREGRRRDAARVPARRAHRPRQLDARRASSASCSRLIGRHLPPPPGVQPPSLWGTEAHLRELFGDQAAAHRRHAADVQLPLPLGRALHRRLPHLVRPGPQGVRGAAARQRRRRSSATSPFMLNSLNRGGADSLVVPSEYLEVVIFRK